MKKSIMRSPVMIIMFVVFCLYAFTILFVVFEGLSVSLISPEFYNSNVNAWYKTYPHFYFKNYADAFVRVTDPNTKTNLIGMTLNSLAYSVGAAFCNILFPSITAYIISRYKFPGRNFLYMYAVVTMMLPIVGATASTLKFYNEIIPILNTPLMIPMFASSFGENFIILFATFKGISWEYAEAAFIDGAGHFRVWLTVMLPQAVSTMFALFMVGFISRWGDTDTALLYMKSYPTIASGLYNFNMRNSYNQPLLYAGFMMSMVPVLALYIAFQKTIMDIQIGGGLKG